MSGTGDDRNVGWEDRKKQAEAETEAEIEGDEPSFEKVLEMLGIPGRYQSTQLLMTYLSKFIISFMAVSYVFIGYDPPHVCNAINETSLLISNGIDLLNYTQGVKVNYDDACKITIATAANNNNNNNSIENGAGISNPDYVTIRSINCPNGRNFYAAKGEPTTYLSEWDLVCESTGTAEWSQTIFVLGQIVGGLLTSQIVDKYGRKPVFLVCTFSVFVLEALVLVAPNIYVIYVIKLFSGTCYQGVVTSYLVSGMELLLPRHRQIYGVSICYLWVGQLILLGGLAYLLQDCSWRYLQGIIVASGATCLLFPFFFNESPRWLASSNQREKALAIIKQACDQNNKDFSKVKVAFDQFIMSSQMRNSTNSPNVLMTLRTTENKDEVSTGVPEEENHSTLAEPETEIVSFNRVKSHPILTLFRTRHLFCVTLIVLYTWVTCNMTYYGLYMTSSSIAGDRFLNYILMALVEIPSNTVILVMLNKLSRRFVLMFFLALSGTSLMVSSIAVSVVHEYELISTALFIFGKFSITCAFNTIFVYTPEIFPTSLRGVGTGFCSSFGRIGSMLAPFLRPLYSVTPWGPGLIFTVMIVLDLFLVPFLPEMKDKNLPNDLADMKKDKEIKG